MINVELVIMAYRSCVAVLCLLNVILGVTDVLTLVGGLFIYFFLYKKKSLVKKKIVDRSADELKCYYGRQAFYSKNNGHNVLSRGFRSEQIIVRFFFSKNISGYSIET